MLGEYNGIHYEVMTDLDDEAQAKIEEMMFNERQKKMGLPQTHEKVQLCDKSISRLRRRAKLCGSNLLKFICRKF
jgi:glycerol dehydrogenase-like iron-containing ADH family enzyme